MSFGICCVCFCCCHEVIRECWGLEIVARAATGVDGSFGGGFRAFECQYTQHGGC